MTELGQSPEFEFLRQQMKTAGAAFDRQFGPSNTVYADALASAQRALEQMENSSAFLKIGDLVKQMENSSAFLKIGDLVEQFEAMRPESFSALSDAASASVYSESARESISRLNAQLDQLRLDQISQIVGATISYRIPDPSPSLATWLDGEHTGEDLVVEETAPDEVETFWLTLMLVAYMLLSVFAMAVKTGNWDAAETVLTMLGTVATIYMATDLLVKKVMK